MCQRENHYSRADAQRQYAWKVMRRFQDAGAAAWYVARWAHTSTDYKLGKQYTAHGHTTKRDFVYYDEIRGGAFHVYTNYEDAVEALHDAKLDAWASQPVLVRVAVSDYIASGQHCGFSTACYRRMMIVSEAKA